MKQLRCTLAAMGLAAVTFTSGHSIAQSPSALDQLQWDTSLDFTTCYLEFQTAETISDTSGKGYGINSRNSKEAYKKAKNCQNSANRNAEARFASVKQKLASKEAATVALKELYIYWRAEMSLGTSRKSYDAVLDRFRSLLERVRVEASW